MPENKRHHYVPRFYLKHFSPDGKSVSLFNCKLAKTIPVASYKAQCYRDYFYGKDQVLEKILAEIEGESATTLGSIIENETLPAGARAEQLAVFLMAQHGRTPAAAALVEMIGDRMDAAFGELTAGEDLAEEMPSFRDVDPLLLSVHLSIKAYKTLADLEARLLMAPPACEFITSDMPVVFYNQLFAYRPRADAASPGWLGFQLFFPIAPRLALMLFDPHVYSVAPHSPNKGFIQLTSSRDVDQLNGLQIASAEENVYFHDRSMDVERLHRLFGKFRAAEPDVDATAMKDGERSGLIAVQIGGVRTKLELTFIAVRTRAKKARIAFQRQRYQPAVVRRPTVAEWRDEPAKEWE